MKNSPIRKTIKELLVFIDRKFYLRFVFIQIFIIISCLMETLSFFSILPLVNLIADTESLNSGIVSFVYKMSGLQSVNHFIFYATIFVLIALILSLILSTLRIWLTTLFANEIGFRVGDNLFSYYLKKDYEFHTEKNSSYLTKQITVEAIRVKNMMKALMQLNSDLFMLTIIMSGLIYYDALKTLTLVFIVGVVYMIMHFYVSGILFSSGRSVSAASKERFGVINNSFGGIADIIRAGCSDHFIAKMRVTGSALARSTTLGQVFASAPAKVLQTLVLIALVSIILYHTITLGDINKLMVTSSVFIMAGYKIMPIFQSIYNSIATIQTNSPAIESLKQDLPSDFNLAYFKDLRSTNKMSGDIVLENVSFTHSGSVVKTIKSVNAIIEKGQMVGIIGPTGSGKSTLINLITSLIAPDSGALKVGGVTVDAGNSRIWKNSIAVIAQDIFLIDGTIAENIAFGINEADIDLDKIERCVFKANMESFISTLPKGVHTEVGERGVQLSGGQKQRIGIARAFYYDAKYLIMDEGTSSLDESTERRIIEELVSVDKDITVIMVAHRLNTLSKCNKIYVLEQGSIVEQGTFHSIIETRNI